MNFNIKRVKIFVTIPVGKTDEIREAICKAGAGQIGSNYEECSYKVVGTGTFRPINDANPFIGSKDNLEFVEEDKLEVICDIDKVKKVVETLRKVHPYEEPAIDIIPLLDEDDFK